MLACQSQGWNWQLWPQCAGFMLCWQVSICASAVRPCDMPFTPSFVVWQGTRLITVLLTCPLNLQEEGGRSASVPQLNVHAVTIETS